MVDVESGTVRQTIRGASDQNNHPNSDLFPNRDGESAVFSPDGRTILYSGGDQFLYEWEVGTGDLAIARDEGNIRRPLNDDDDVEVESRPVGDDLDINNRGLDPSRAGICFPLGSFRLSVKGTRRGEPWKGRIGVDVSRLTATRFSFRLNGGSPIDLTGFPWTNSINAYANIVFEGDQLAIPDPSRLGSAKVEIYREGRKVKFYWNITFGRKLRERGGLPRNVR